MDSIFVGFAFSNCSLGSGMNSSWTADAKRITYNSGGRRNAWSQKIAAASIGEQSLKF